MKVNLSKNCKRLACAAMSMVLCAAAAVPMGVHAESGSQENWTMVFNEEFDDPVLDQSKFSDSYLPHWTTTEQSIAHYDLYDGMISLNIEKDTQGPWWADAGVQKVSSIQTGMRDGMHLFWDSCTVLDHHRAVTNFETKYGYFELRAKVPGDGGLHSAWWMIGNESAAHETAEIDIFEICGPDCKTDKSRVRVSVHPWKDKDLHEQSLDYYPKCNVTDDFHVYGFEWRPEGMKFYFDGELVKQTSQSPDYKMTTLLGIYENDAPLWSGTPDYNSQYPKRFEIDYFRAYKTDEMLQWDAEENRMPTDGENLAPYAVAGGAQDWSWQSPPSNMIDNDAYSAFQSNEAPGFPQYLYLDWDESRTFDTFVMKTAYGQQQAPTEWTLEVSADGQSDWTPVASSGQVQWQSNDWHVDSHTMTFDPVQAKALRIRIDSANLEWNHYAINEIQVWNSGTAPVGVNVASETTSEWNSSNGGLLTDGDRYAAAQSKDRPGFPEPIVLRWTRPVSLNRVDLYSWYARHQAPTSVSIQVSCDDGATWQEVLPQTALEWMYEDETLECSSLSFPRVDGVTQLKLTVHDGNLKWKHFAINELEAYLES